MRLIPALRLNCAERNASHRVKDAHPELIRNVPGGASDVT